MTRRQRTLLYILLLDLLPMSIVWYICAESIGYLTATIIAGAFLVILAGFIVGLMEGMS